VTQEGDGSYGNELLCNKPIFKNTQEEMREWNRKVHALEGSAEQRADFARRLALVNAAGVVPVCNEGQFSVRLLQRAHESTFSPRESSGLRRLPQASPAPLSLIGACNREGPCGG